MEKNLVIVGNGGFAHEIKLLVDRINKIDKKWNFCGFIDKEAGNDVVGNDDYILSAFKKLNVVIAIGSPVVRRKITEKYKINPNVVYPNLIDPSVILENKVRMGQGNIICAGSILTTDIMIGDFNIINLSCTIGHDTVIKNFVTINPGSNISGNVNLNNGVEIGTGTKMIQGITIGVNTVVGAGSVVIRDLTSDCTVAGVPARVIKEENK